MDNVFLENFLLRKFLVYLYRCARGSSCALPSTRSPLQRMPARDGGSRSKTSSVRDLIPWIPLSSRMESKALIEGLKLKSKGFWKYPQLDNWFSCIAFPAPAFELRTTPREVSRTLPNSCGDVRPAPRSIPWEFQICPKTSGTCWLEVCLNDPWKPVGLPAGREQQFVLCGEQLDGWMEPPLTILCFPEVASTSDSPAEKQTCCGKTLGIFVQETQCRKSGWMEEKSSSSGRCSQQHRVSLDVEQRLSTC
ncbi:PREDICTED: uncharacterized protein LOC106892259 isoform X3 [Calidris pugnax]|uniref:uncharacterized protein LOC106892259 isoform X3 n=1 Tax=Calidris pugnax TaxID=198806 RepID=UPI00071CE4A5|nr:PREDICTED: uncharacterized protein LOC106892259 isoform X3 [Calidris pugnax]